MSGQKLKNTLEIKLADPVVYLKDVDFSGRRRTHNENSPPSMLRGILVLNIVKPTRISSIEIELQGKSATSWPEGAGPRRIEVVEDHKIYCANTVYFKAGSAHAASRRAISVDPGLSHYRDEHEDEDSPASDDEHEYTLPVSRGRAHTRRASADHSTFQREFVSHEEAAHIPTPPYTPGPTSPAISPSPSIVNLRSMSTHPSPTTTHSHSPAGPSGQSFHHRDDTPGQALEDFRRALRSELNPALDRTSPSSSTHGRPHQEPSSSTSSITSPHHDYFVGHVNFESDSRRNSFDGRSRSRDTPVPPERPVRSPSRHDSEEDARGRHHKKFGLSLVSNSIFDRMRSNSPLSARSQEREKEREKDRSARGKLHDKHDKGKAKEALIKVSEVLGLDHDEGKEFGDGWKEFKKGTYTYPISFMIPADSPPTMRLEYGSVLWRLKATVHRPGTFKTKLTIAREVVVVATPSDDDTEDTENIVVERAWEDQMQYLLLVSGRSYAMGGTMPVQMTFMPFSKMKVHRISLLVEEKVSYYTQMNHVTRTATPTRIPLLSIKYPDGSARPILPLPEDIAFKASPLYKLLMTDDGTSIEDHPQSDLSEYASDLASQLMGPGPWKLQFDVKLPASCVDLHPTNANKKSNLLVHHTLKIVVRVERGDDELVDEHGKRRLFDIVVQTPIHILSCLCNSDHTLLPRYSEAWEDSSAIARACCCSNGQRDQTHTRLALDSAGLPSNPIESNDSGEDLAARSPPQSARDHEAGALMYERLVTGQETVMGEAPPPYRPSAYQATAIAV